MNLYTLIWEARPLLLFMSREEFYARLDEWDIEALTVGGKPAFALKTKGPEFDLVDLKTGAAFPLKAFLARLKAMLDEFDYVTTKAQKLELEDISFQFEPETLAGTGVRHRFIRRLGFVQTGEDEHDIHYRLDPDAFLRRRVSRDLH